jgi:hypothetical protein
MFDAFSEADESPAGSPRHERIKGRISMLGVLFAFVFMFLGCFAAVAFGIFEWKTPFNILAVGIGGACCVAAGLSFGIAVGCLFAPLDFLLSPIGGKWLKMIGVKSVLAARIVCAAVTMTLVPAALAVTWMTIQRMLF